MADEIATALMQGAEAPPAADDPSGTGSPAPSAEGAGSGTAGTPETDDLPGSIKEYLAANPNAKDAVDLVTREMRRGLTPKLQEAAELRKKLEGLDDDSLRSLRDLRQLAQTDPAAAAKWLRDYADSLHGTAPPAAPDYQPATDSEAALYRKVQELESRLQRTSQGFEAMTLQQQAFQVGEQFNRIAKEVGVDIPVDVRRQCFEQSRAIGGALSPTDIYFARNRDAVVARIAQKARDEAAGVVAGKAAGAAGNPNGVTPRGPAPDDEAPKDLRGLIAYELRKRQT